MTCDVRISKYCTLGFNSAPPKVCDTFDELLRPAFVLFPCDMTRIPASGDSALLWVRGFLPYCAVLRNDTA